MMDRSPVLLALVSAVLITADWWTKLRIHASLALGETRPVVEGWLYFAHRENPGVAFSLFADASATWRTPFLALISLAGIAVFLALARSTRDGPTRAAVALVVAGAVGNLGDRLVNGHVTDFIFVTFFPYVFNVADAAITVGGVLLAARMLFAPRTEAEPATAAG
jgi:signal peptidase II